MIFFAVAVAVWTAYALPYDIFYTYSFWCELLAKLVEVNLKSVSIAVIFSYYVLIAISIRLGCAT